MSFGDLKIPHKLVAVFAVMLATIMLMGGALYANKLSFEHSVGRTERAYESLRAADIAAFRLTRQENSLRGFLLSGDNYYVKRLEEAHKPKFLAALETLKTLAKGDKDDLARIATVEAAYANFRQQAIEPGKTLGADPATRQQAVELVRNEGVADKAVAPVEDSIDAIVKNFEGAIAVEAAAQKKASAALTLTLAIGILITAAIAVVGGLILSGGIATPVAAMTAAMRRLASGDNTIEVPAAGRKDEIGEMAAAVTHFKEAAIAKERLESDSAGQRSQTERERAEREADKAADAQADAVAIGALGEALDRLANGDLTHRIVVAFAPKAAQLKTDFNAAAGRLQDAMKSISVTTEGVSAGSDEIARAADDLSRRTEQQAASLEETAAALDEITATVKKSADGASHARAVVQTAKTGAADGGDIVRQAVLAMGEIEKSSTQISQIIGVIDEIAFQTNLLALNAGVEAARAGEAGKGFAVVASEVRALAQRSAEAAKEIKALISASSTQVGSGVQLVGKTGQALEMLVAQVDEIDGLVGEIAASAKEQAVGLNEVNAAVNKMDQVTQQNAAMVEQSTAASHNLAQEAQGLAGSVSMFRIGEQHAPPPAIARNATTATTATPARRPPAAAFAARHGAPQVRTSARDGAALRKPAPQSGADEWEEF